MPPLTHADNRPCRGGEGVGVALNPDAGGGTSDEVRELVAERLPHARIVEVRPAEATTSLRALASDVEILGIAGGDGSANAAAVAALPVDRPVLLLPSGTLNHLARDLGLDSPDHAIEMAEAGRLAVVDVALIAGQPFLNTASIGSYVELVDLRERLEGTIGKWPAAMVSLIRVLRRSKTVSVLIDGQHRDAWVVFFGNCAYTPAGFAPKCRVSLDDRQIDVRLLLASGRWTRTRLLLSALAGRLDRSHLYQRWLADRVEITSEQGPLRISRDGETGEGSEAFVVEKHPEQLRIFAGR